MELRIAAAERLEDPLARGADVVAEDLLQRVVEQDEVEVGVDDALCRAALPARAFSMASQVSSNAYSGSHARSPEVCVSSSR